MAVNEKRISYRAGISRKPSDFLCKEGELAECVNLTTDGEELKVTVPLTVTEGASMKLVFIHRTGGQDNRIFDNGGWLYYNGSRIANSYHYSDSVVTVAALGNVLVASFDGVLRRWLWNGSGYTDVTAFPEPQVAFHLESDGDATRFGVSEVKNEQNSDGIIYHGGIASQTRYNDMVVGLYAKNLRDVKRKKGFAEPFMACVALELYDGSYVFMTAPVLLWPTRTMNSYGNDYNQVFTLRTRYNLLFCSQATDYRRYSDIVRDVVVFVSDGVGIYDTAADQPLTRYGTSVNITDGILKINGRNQPWWEQSPASQDDYIDCWDVLVKRAENEIVDDLKTLPAFYRLCSLGLSPVEEQSLAGRIGSHTLENLTTQGQLSLDYYSHGTLMAEGMYSYNSRLHLWGIRRSIFEGFGYFMPFDAPEAHTYDFYVTIRTTIGDQVVKHSATTSQRQGIWFFYPDPRARHVVIMKDDNSYCVLDEDLTEHPTLNGAYYFGGYDLTESSFPLPSPLPHATAVDEPLSDYVLQSEVDNPYVFRASGYVRVDGGRVVGLTAQVHALSQGQFGQYPLTVFTSDGIWAMEIDDVGQVIRTRPVSREVCLYGSSITQTDDALFFVSKKGLMRLRGVEVICVSGVMDGSAFDTQGVSELTYTSLNGNSESRPWASTVYNGSGGGTFRSFLVSSDFRMAYDYMEQRLLLLNSGYDYCWVYSLADGSFSKMVLSDRIVNVVNAYPDYLLQDVDMGMYSLYGKGREEEVRTRQTAFLLTRPLKLGGGLAVSSLRELKNVGVWDESGGSVVKTEVFVSDDLVNWTQLHSRFGAAAKYFRIALYLKLLPTERLSGTIVREEERRTEHLK